MIPKNWSAVLSPRLQQTLAALLAGDSEKQIAARLSLSQTTIHQYVTSLYRHFGVQSRAQLLAHALRATAQCPWDTAVELFAQDCEAGLSPRLRQTLGCLLDGSSEKEVAARLSLSAPTAHQYVRLVYDCFGVRSRPQLLAYALRRLLERDGHRGSSFLSGEDDDSSGNVSRLPVHDSSSRQRTSSNILAAK